MEFLGWGILCWQFCSFLEFPFWNFRDLLASLFLQRSFLGGVSGRGILAGNSFLSFVLGKNCLGGLAWLEIAGIFLPQQGFPGWSFVSGTSLVSRCVFASYLGGVSWVEVPCSAPGRSWNSLFGISGICSFPLSAEKFPRWSFWAGHPGWQFFAFLCLGEKLPRWTYTAPSWNSLFGISGICWLPSFCREIS